jgi:hypothetical protein
MTTTADIPQDLLDRVAALTRAQQVALRATLPETDLPPDDEKFRTGEYTADEVKAMLTRRWQDYQSGKTKAFSFEESSHLLREFVEGLQE